MNKLKFTKMHGAGNDYIYFNCFEQSVADPAALSVRLSDRHKSIGGDGIILICPTDKADVKMRIFNADGSEGKMCGNGIRCVAKYAYDHNLVDSDTVRVDTLSGVKTIKLTVENGVAVAAKVDMGAAEFKPERIPVLLDGDEIVSRPVKIGGTEYKITCVSMGNPHCVVFCDEIANLDLPTIGPRFEKNPLFPESVNTEFVTVNSDGTLSMRVWERGSGETLACGTGACAVVSAAVKNGFCKADTDVTVHLLGGDLVIRYTDKTVFMTGEAVEAFEGCVEL